MFVLAHNVVLVPKFNTKHCVSFSYFLAVLSSVLGILPPIKRIELRIMVYIVRVYVSSLGRSVGRCA